VNDSTFGHDITAPVNIVRLQATELAAEIGNPQAGTMVMVGAYSALTGLVGLDAAIEGMRESIPSYRSQHIEANERALRAGFDAVTPGAYPAWQEVGV
jgi:2-oxoglutarate ferredoxin oxidoreductase subunit gamma